MSKQQVDCPQCIGCGEEYVKGKVKECSLCKGKGKVDSELAEDYISSINILNTDDYEIFDS